MSRGSVYGISRVDNEVSRTHGWLVTVQRRGEIFRKQDLIPCTSCRYCTDGCPNIRPTGEF